MVWLSSKRFVQGIAAEKKEARAEKEEAEKYKKLQEDYVSPSLPPSLPQICTNSLTVCVVAVG